MRRLALVPAALVPLMVALAADPFWVARAPQQWSDAELAGLLEASPWAQTDKITVYFGTAGPVRAAEQELARRRGAANPEFERDTDYDEFLRDHGDEVIVVTVRAQDQTGLLVTEELARLERESQLRTGKKILKLEAFFPPTKADPVLRLVFPRELDPKADKVRLELYIPAMDGKAWRNFEFLVEPMRVSGKLEI